MIGLDVLSQAPPLVRHNSDAVRQIVECVEEGTYCAILGPRLSGKTVLLQYVKDTLAEHLGWTCIYVDLYDVKATTQRGFFADLIHLTAQRVDELARPEAPGFQLSLPDASEVSSVAFRGFLADIVSHLQRDLVLIIEHLEAIPSDLVQALLTSLRAAYMEQQMQDYRLVVMVSGALSLATLTVGESSPFRGIARRVFVGDLSEGASEALIAAEITLEGILATERAQGRLLRATSGDPYLIRQICRRCAEIARGRPSQRLRGRDVIQVTRQFLQDDVFQYAPLQEAVRLIEEDPDLLRCILLLLAHGTVPRVELPLPLSPDVDPLYLTGVVERVEGDSYRLQNRIYGQFLAQHLQPGRVGHLLAMAGRWDSAIEYLEASIREGNEQSRIDLLPATINSMYAAEDIGQAARFLTRGLSAAFGVVDAKVWYAPPQEECLRLVGHLGPRGNGALRTVPDVPLAADRLESRAYRQASSLRGKEGGRHVWRAIPLLFPGRKPVGVVTVCDDLLDNRFVDQRERDLQLMGYLSQAARAIQVVSTRRRELMLAGRMQASLLPAAPPELAHWQLAATLRPARETSGDFYDFIPLPDGRLGAVIADVADKGMGAALYMALSRTLIRTYAAEYPSRPDLALNAANRRILADTDADLFVTVFYGILDPATGELTYCNAGHHPPYLFTAREEGLPQPLPGNGMPLGVVEDARLAPETVQIDPGTALLLYTDGIVDAQNQQQEFFGRERMLEIAQATLAAPSAQGMQDALLSAVFGFMGDGPQFDDVTLMVVVREP